MIVTSLPSREVTSMHEQHPPLGRIQLPKSHCVNGFLALEAYVQRTIGNKLGAGRVDQVPTMHSRGRGYAGAHQDIRRHEGHRESSEVEEEVEFESAKCNLVYFSLLNGRLWSR